MNMRTLPGAAVVAMCIGSAAQAAPVTITNHSFESDALNNGAFQIGSPTGWVAELNAGYQDPNTAMFPTVPDGENTSWAGSGCFSGSGCHGGSLWQTLDATLQKDMLYTLTVDIGWRDDNVPLSAFEVQLLSYDDVSKEFEVLASNDLAEADFGTEGDGTFQTLAVKHTSRAASPEKLAVRLLSKYTSVQGNQYRQVNFDNVRLDASAVAPLPNEVPEPATLALLSAGLFGLGFTRRRKA